MAKLGFNGKLYYLTTGTRATWGAIGGDGFSHTAAANANLSEVTLARDVTYPIAVDKADVTSRASGGWKASLPALSDLSIEFQMVYDPTDTPTIAILKAFFLKTTIALAALDGAKGTAGVSGICADCCIVKCDKSESLSEGQMLSITAVPTASAVNPEWVKVS